MQLCAETAFGILCEACSGDRGRVQEYRRHSAATVRSSPKLREGSRSIVDKVVLDVACSLSVFSESALNKV